MINLHFIQVYQTQGFSTHANMHTFDQEPVPISSVEEGSSNNNKPHRTELDSHANMVVIGKNVTILNETGRYAEVAPFTPDYESLHHVPIVDACVEYNDFLSGEIDV